MNLSRLKTFAGSTLFALTAALAFMYADSPKPVDAKADDKPKPKVVHGKGFKLPPKEVSAAQHRISNAKHGDMLKKLPIATQATYDAYTATGGSCVPPIGDQGQCGNCYMWSGSKVCSAAQMTANVVKPGSGFMLSVQWGLDYHPELGGCDGGDEYQVAQVIQSGGAPSVTSYPGAGQSPGTKLPTTGMTLYTVGSIVYVDPTQTNQGVASTQSIKNAILAYGYVSVAVDASGAFWNDGTGTDTGTGTNIDHAIGATGWDDTHDNGDGSKGAFIGDNQWGKQWGSTIDATPGRLWVKYGADSFGTEAFVAIAAAGPPVPPAPPNPPVPPTPGTKTITQIIATFSDGSTQTLLGTGSGGLVITPTTTLQDLLNAMQPVKPMKEKEPGFAPIKP